MKRSLPLLVAPVLVPALLLTGCSGTSAADDDGRIRVVASTDVWGDVVRQIGGPAVSVDSIISDPDRDPHEYAADPRDQLAVSRARKIERFFSQPFHVAEVFTGSPGKYVSLKDTIRGFKGIVDGEYDHLPEQAFYMVGTIDEAVEKAKKIA